MQFDSETQKTKGKTTEGKSSRGKRAESGVTPVMQQYFRAKAQYPNAIVFFHLGDFYEMFYDDAVCAAKVLDLTLTSRGRDGQGEAIPMAGVPRHAAAGYLAKLVGQGYSVALCEQMADPSMTRGIVPREVVRVVTPGLAAAVESLDKTRDHWLVAVTRSEQGVAYALLDFSRSELRYGTASDVSSFVSMVPMTEVRELICAPDAALEAMARDFFSQVPLRQLEASTPAFYQRTRELLAGLCHEKAEVIDAIAAPAALILAYVEATQPAGIEAFSRCVAYRTTSDVLLDDKTVRHLELVESSGGDKDASLLMVIDQTRTPMGRRELRRRLLQPLGDVNAIHRRLSKTRALLDNTLRTTLFEALDQIGDIERFTTRSMMGLASARELQSLSQSLVSVCELMSTIVARRDLAMFTRPVDVLTRLSQYLIGALVTEPIAHGQTNGVIRSSFNAELKRLREMSASGEATLLALERREREKTGIATLKVRYTRVFGYYIEVTRPNLASVPAHYRRKQTVASGERFTIDELTELEETIESAADQAQAIETRLVSELRAQIGKYAAELYAFASLVADIDVHASLAHVAVHHNYHEPMVDHGFELTLVNARHPVVERLASKLGARHAFVPNTIEMHSGDSRFWMISGPNMGGKSTLMRQVALNVLLAQMGSFVACDSAQIGVCDGIFTRIGASDDLSRGQSTFMVEMSETASLLRRATARSLVVIDEVGRGTGAKDGAAIAQAIAEYLHDEVRARTLFATHFHSLLTLPEHHVAMVSKHMAAVSDDGDGHDVTFLYTLRSGPALASYGVAVAKLAGIPASVLDRAKMLIECDGESQSKIGHVQVD